MLTGTKLYLILCLLFASAALLSAQTAAEMQTILNSPAVTYGQAALFVIASASDEVSAGNEDGEQSTPGQTQQNAFDLAVSRGWIHQKAKLNEPIKLRELSFLIMKAFDMKGGLMYSIFPGPRYGYRSLVSRSVIRSGSDPGMTVSGDWFLLILGNVLHDMEGEL